MDQITLLEFKEALISASNFLEINKEPVSYTHLTLPTNREV